MALRRKAAANAAAAREVDLDAMVLSGPQGAYEALQLYRSKATRMRAKNDVRGAIQVIVHGSKCLLGAGYENAGAELSLLLLDVLNEGTAKTESDAELRTLVSDLEKAFPPASKHRIDLLKGCVKWTNKHGIREYGDPAMHTILARCLWENNEHNQAVYHFAAGEAPDTFCHLLESTFSGEANSVKREQMLVLCIMHFLALENLRDANELLNLYRRTQKGRGNNATESNLLTFCKYLLLVCRRDAQPLFKTLVTKYASVLDYDETVPSLLMGPIGAKFFGIQPKSNPMMSMLHQMLA